MTLDADLAELEGWLTGLVDEAAKPSFAADRMLQRRNAVRKARRALEGPCGPDDDPKSVSRPRWASWSKEYETGWRDECS
jgi:hypothetical protein